MHVIYMNIILYILFMHVDACPCMRVHACMRGEITPVCQDKEKIHQSSMNVLVPLELQSKHEEVADQMLVDRSSEHHAFICFA